jgi:hypothetical protein
MLTELITFVVVDGSTFVIYNVTVISTALYRMQRVLLFACYTVWDEGVSTVTLIPGLSRDCRRPLLDVEKDTYLAMKKVGLWVS